ncbi:ribonuclease HI [Bdellovibrio sp. HCB337]|uniref:ribonuclease HI n=1 Tax=Bdellovibrio sp. HCB337 TaxID=3394358 RepID=UPI0039A4A907
MNYTGKEIIVFTDGACSGNPGPGGWGSVVLLPTGSVQELGGGDSSTTNNRMEMHAVGAALEHLADTPGDIIIYTDSTYVIRGITQWVWGWKRNNWRTAEGKDVSNKDIWQDLFALVVKRKDLGKIHWNYTRGHMGTPGNERCDEIAVGFSKGYRVSLYVGPLSGYGIDILDLPEHEELPEMKPNNKGEKKVAYSYLSNIGGVVIRHKDWGSCERRVKGQSGAKFKKTMSENEEQEVLKSWGLSGAAIKES